MKSWKKTIINCKSSIKLAIKNLNNSGLKICLVENEFGNFIGTITDGDIRRGLIKGLKLSDNINRIINKKSKYVNSYCTKIEADKIMSRNKIFHLPIIENKKICGIYFHKIETEIKLKKIKNTFVINAGGRGLRLRPMTDQIPKPMIKINGKPMIEHIILKAKDEGFKNFIIIVHYLKDKIINHFKDGKKLGIKINYVVEKIPLGTAGGLSLLNNKVSEDFIFTNADVLSNFRFKELIEYHMEKNSLITMAVKNIEVKENYGLVNIKKNEVVSLQEKPILKKFINCGIYSLNKKILKNFSKNQKIDMITFLEKFKFKKKKIYAFPVHETWRDLSLKKFLKSEIKI